MSKKENDKTTIIVALISGFFGLITSTSTILLNFYLNKQEVASQQLEQAPIAQVPSTKGIQQTIEPLPFVQETFEFFSLMNVSILILSIAATTVIGLFILKLIRRKKK